MTEENTLLDIANAALLSVGDRMVSALNDTGDQTSMKVSLLMRQVILDVESASALPWKELYTVKPLVLREKEPFCGSWVYNKPTDCLCMISVGSRDMQEKLVWHEEGNLIYIDSHAITPEKQVLCRYSKKSFDPQEWGSDLRGCVVSLLAARAAGAIMANPTVSQNMEREFWQNEFVRRTGNAVVNTECESTYPQGIHMWRYQSL